MENQDRRGRKTELRASIAGGQKKISGYAAVVNSYSEDLGGFREIILPGAFRNALSYSDVRGLFNHDPNMVLARTKSGTLKLNEDSFGLYFEMTLPDTQVGRDVYENIRLGNISGCSFSFIVAPGGDEWSYDSQRNVTRTISQFQTIFDVGPVVFPAYQSTSCEISERTRKALQEFRSSRGIGAGSSSRPGGLSTYDERRRKLDRMDQDWAGQRRSELDAKERAFQARERDHEATMRRLSRPR